MKTHNVDHGLIIDVAWPAAIEVMACLALHRTQRIAAGPSFLGHTPKVISNGVIAKPPDSTEDSFVFDTDSVFSHPEWIPMWGDLRERAAKIPLLWIFLG